MSVDRWLAIAGLALVPLALVLGLTARRPKLRYSGGGSGTVKIPGRDVMVSSLTLRQKRTVWGLRLPREPAHIASARLYDPRLGEYVGPPLRWRVAGDLLETTIVIASGQQADLVVFGKDRHAQDFFIFDAPAMNGPLASHLTMFDGKNRDFVLVLTDEVGREHRIDIIAQSTAQSVHTTAKVTLENRLTMVGTGLRTIARAFTAP